MLVAPRRAVVTGLGFWRRTESALQNSRRHLWLARVVGPITLIDASSFSTRIAGEVKHFDPSRYIALSPIKLKKMARQTQLALAATDLAFKDAGFDPQHNGNGAQIPVVIGVSSSAIDVIETWQIVCVRKGLPGSALRRGFLTAACNRQRNHREPAVQDAKPYHIHRVPAGLDAIASAVDLIRSGKADLAVAGGADAPINTLTCASFCCSGLVSKRNDEPERASRPFDRHRDGGIMAEGAGIVVIEELSHALARGAHLYLEICGYGSSVDAKGAEDASG